MSSFVIVANSANNNFAERALSDATQDRQACLELAGYFKALASGHESASFDFFTSAAAPVAASGTWTLNTVVATDTVTVGSVTFTGTDTPTTNLHFDTSLATDALIAADLAATVNAHPTIGQIVHATAAGAVVTVTARQAGVVGNFIEFTDADSTITSSGSGYLAGGTGGVVGAPVSINRA